jgi:hypothetical protein
MAMEQAKDVECYVLGGYVLTDIGAFGKRATRATISRFDLSESSKDLRRKP